MIGIDEGVRFGRFMVLYSTRLLRCYNIRLVKPESTNTEHCVQLLGNAGLVTLSYIGDNIEQNCFHSTLLFTSRLLHHQSCTPPRKLF